MGSSEALVLFDDEVVGQGFIMFQRACSGGIAVRIALCGGVLRAANCLSDPAVDVSRTCSTSPVSASRCFCCYPRVSGGRQVLIERAFDTFLCSIGSLRNAR